MAAIHPKRTELEFRNVTSYSSEVICGEYNAVSVMGEETGYRRFIVRSGAADKRPREADYAIYCSKNPADQLSELFGIEQVDGSNATLIKILEDFRKLSEALASYEKDMYAVPKGEFGLEQLSQARVDVAPPRKFRDGGYIERVPQDPWRRPYLYSASPLGGVKGSYEIKTLGADGLPGGTGQNADISTKQLGYLRHVLGYSN